MVSVRQRRFSPTLVTLVFAMLCAGVALLPRHVHADEFCWADPLVSINGKLTHITVGIDASAAAIRAAGVTAFITVIVPEDVPASLVSIDPLGAFPERVTFVKTDDWSTSRHAIPAVKTDDWSTSRHAIPVTIVVSFTSGTSFGAAVQVVDQSGSMRQITGTTRFPLMLFVGQ